MNLEIDWNSSLVGPTDDNAQELRVKLDAEPDTTWHESFNLTADERQKVWRAAGRRWGIVKVEGETIIVVPVDQTEAPILKAELERLVEHANKVTTVSDPSS